MSRSWAGIPSPKTAGQLIPSNWTLKDPPVAIKGQAASPLWAFFQPVTVSTPSSASPALSSGLSSPLARSAASDAARQLSSTTKDKLLCWPCRLAGAPHLKCLVSWEGHQTSTAKRHLEAMHKSLYDSITVSLRFAQCVVLCDM